ncbi:MULTISPECIES: phosphoribosylamine--glycine ligase [unclassified Exiguobacterium]|uniref:phosphoribosylamine--glycine ligase n=1 Tax=unclassified Exiguobacterium TaxID=2644629 RepID=UPI00103F95F2|nr:MULTISPECIES: phosphoribosylamine--glycine ligase [unclassified Exiguobacterium]TCI44731.1 phosphoribosylamine--glycine ligase [Exiguobacterium sp. SH5S32]TCI51138.1 phosphoribosylamine--glycine ligase [Exiguobacterium sp. SH1S4]TCI70112.1 phosphoribosylamine--glycine ligase [Exiguobacterium sp. SH1S1]
MNVLVIGRGGREHALAWKLRQDGHDVFVAPGNLNMDGVTCVPIEETDVTALVRFAETEDIDWTIVGPESALMAGVVDAFNASGRRIFGPTKAAALLEGSKAFAKEIMREANIPTAAYETFTEAKAALAYIESIGAPLVVKADGLAAGKGVTVAFSLDEARAAIHDIFATDKFGDQSRVVIEEFLDGEEFSLMAFVSGEHVIPMITSQDHKRAFDGDKGPNTGGMGAYSPMPHLEEAVYVESVERVLVPLAREMVERGTPFEGFLYAGLILTEDGPKVIEFNARFGDPETEVILPNLVSPLLDVIEAAVAKRPYAIEWLDGYTIGVVVAAAGYPERATTGQVLSDFERLPKDVLVFHAGTTRDGSHIIGNGGRLFVITSTKPTLLEAKTAVYAALEQLTLPHTFYRRDIGGRALARIF